MATPLPRRIFATTGTMSANNEDLSPSGPPRVMLIDGEPPIFEVLDEATVRYTWSKPNPFFLPALASAAPALHLSARALPQAISRALQIGRKKEKEEGFGGSATGRPSTTRTTISTSSTIPDLPTLQPWVNTTRPPADPFRRHAQSLFPPDRPRGASAPLYRRSRHDGRRQQTDPGQSRLG